MIGISSDESLKNQGLWLLIFGTFVFFGGILGFISNPLEAKTALISGIVFGVLIISIGMLLRKCIGFARWLGLSLLGVLVGAFTWRAAVSWEAVSLGEPKEFAAILITSMLIGAILTIFRLFKG